MLEAFGRRLGDGLAELLDVIRPPRQGLRRKPALQRFLDERSRAIALRAGDPCLP